MLFNRKWFLATFVVIAAVAVMIRLGFWQLDRLVQRQAFNRHVTEQTGLPALDLNNSSLVGIEGMEYREVIARGVYDFENQVVLRNQAYNQEFGVHLLTPLNLEGSDAAVLVNRGWVPQRDFENGDLEQYNETGTVEVQGVIRSGQVRSTFGRRDVIPAEGKLDAWYLVNVAAIDRQVDYDLLPVYIQQAPDPGQPLLPHRSLPELVLTEGSHLGYAIQWFLFALILGAGYPFYVRQMETQILQASGKRSTGGEETSYAK